jgi:hypothetical protein
LSIGRLPAGQTSFIGDPASRLEADNASIRRGHKTMPLMRLCVWLFASLRGEQAGSSGLGLLQAAADSTPRSWWITGPVSGRAACQTKNASAACSTSMPSPSLTAQAAWCAAQRMNGVGAAP